MDRLLTYIKNYVSLTEEEENVVKERYHFRKLKKKEHYLLQGEYCRFEAFILNGTTRVYHTNEKGTEHVLYFGLKDWWVGDIISFYNQVPATFSIQALEETHLLEISREDKEELFSLVPALERMFRQITENHLRAMQNRFLSTLSESADLRYQRLLDHCPQINQLVPQHQIASYLGILPESFSRIKRNLLG